MKEDKSIYKELSEERKHLQETGKLPDWVTTASWQVLKDKYLTKEYPDLFSTYNRISKRAASYLPNEIQQEWETKFFDILWKGYFGLASPVLSNMGMESGCPVSCSGGVIDDSVVGFYEAQREAAALSQNGFGTSGYLGNIRPRGSKISNSTAKASGVLPVFKDFVQMSRDISQGSTRRGAWAGYIEIEHPDFYEIATYIKNNPEDANIGWIIRDSFIERLDNGDKDAIGRYQESLYLKMLTGKGYYFFIDKVNRANPEMYKKHGFEVKASNLCLVGDTLVNVKRHDSNDIIQMTLKELCDEFEFNMKFNQDADLYVETLRDGEIIYNLITNAGKTGMVTDMVDVILEDDTIVECTPEHRFYTRYGWLEAINLEAGDLLVNNKNNTIKIKEVKVKNYLTKIPVYDITVPETECFFANGILVHNCTEITLFSDEEHTFSCIISSMNLAKWDEYKNSDAIFVATVFLDCVVSDFLETAKNKPGLEKVLNFTKKGRAIGLGVMGFHTYLQNKMIPFDSLETNYFNIEVFKKLDAESLRASKWLAEILGEPEWCEGFGVRNTHRCVTEDTTLLTKKGYVNIIDVLGQDIEIWNGHEWSLVNPYKTSDNSELLEFVLSDGSSIKTTLNHRWLIKNNRFAKPVVVESKDLNIGDKLDKWDLPIIEGSINFPYAYTHGFYCGDGSETQSKPQYENCKKRKEIRIYADNKKQCLTLLQVKDTCEIRTQKDGSLRFYIPDEVPEKWVVPDITHTVETRLNWLAGLYDADGSNNGKIVSIHFDFLKKIKDMLSYTGIFSTIKKVDRSSGFSNKPRTYYTLHISKNDLANMVDMGFCSQRITIKKGTYNKKQYVYIEKINKVDNEPTYCLTESKRGTALFNGIKTLQCAVAPTITNALISGGVSQGVEPIYKNTFTQATASGEVDRISPKLLEIMKERKVYNQETIKDIILHQGSVYHVDWLTDEEKRVFATAFEISQKKILWLAEARQPFIDQAQSINLFLSSDAKEEYISELHELAFKMKHLKSLYYIRSSSGVNASTGDACTSCVA